MKDQTVFMRGVMLFLAIAISYSLPTTAQAQHSNHRRFPHLSIQQSWVNKNQIAILEVLAKFDLIQAPLTQDQIRRVKAINPNAIILPFDSMKWDRDMLPLWTDNTGRPDVSDDCPVYRGNGSKREVAMDGRRYQDWRAIVSTNWKAGGFDGVYLDHWDKPYWGDTNRYTKQEYKDGMSHLAEKMRAIWPEGIFIGNGAVAIDFSYAFNGFMLEDFHRTFEGLLEAVKDWEQNGNDPSMIILNQRSWGPHVVEDKSVENKIAADFWERMRYTITMSMLTNSLYAMYNQGSGGLAHWASPWWFDEYDVDLGQPAGEAYQLPNGVWARKFDKGLVLCNATGYPQTVKASDLGSTTYYRFRGSQQPQFNDGQRFTEITLDGWGYEGRTDGPWGQPIGDGIILVKAPQTIVSEILIDDEGYDTNKKSEHMYLNLQGRFAQTGMTFDPVGYRRWTDAYYIHGHNSCYFAPAGSGSATARWTPAINLPGRYEVFEWHPAASDLASNARFVIHHAQGETAVQVDQTRNGGQWNSLGTFKFDAGTSGYVKVTGSSNRTVVADAVKFVSVDFDSGGDNGHSDITPPSPPKGVKVVKQ